MSQDITLGPPRGMRDFYPEEMAARNRIFTAWHDAARLHGFLNYDSCVVENLALLKRKAGEEITDQIYSFTDKSSRELALRPEMTPTLARMIIARQNAMQLPVKWYTIAQCFRYERMSKGRKREHYQWNMDIAGEASSSAEAEILAAAAAALNLLGLGSDDIRIRINSRALMTELMTEKGVPADQVTSVFMAIDKFGKIPEDEITAMLKQSGLSDQSVRSVFDIMAIRGLDAVRQTAKPDSKAFAEVSALYDSLKSYGIAGLVEFDMSVVRGLGYYTGIVFECYDIAKNYRAIFGGGRYDNLIADLGGSRIPCVGIGFGDVVIAEILADKGLLPSKPQYAGIAIGFMDQGSSAMAVQAACHFRKNGESVDLGLAPEKPKNFFSRCNAAGYDKAVYIGPDDVKAGRIRLKDLKTRQEAEIVI